MLLAKTRAAEVLPRDVRVYAIVLEGSPRADELAAQLEDVGLADAVEWVIRARDAEDGIRGCFHSHQEVMRRFVDSDAKAAVVPEDVVRFEPRGDLSVAEAVRDAVDAIRGGVAIMAASFAFPCTVSCFRLSFVASRLPCFSASMAVVPRQAGAAARIFLTASRRPGPGRPGLTAA